MFTLIGWSASQDSAVLIPVAGIADPHVRVSGNDIIVPTALSNLAAAYSVGVNNTRCQLVSPSLRRVLNYEVAPLDVSATPLAPFRWSRLTENPIKLDPEEALNAFSAENGAGAQRQNIFAWLSDGPLLPVKGDIRTVRVTATQTLVAFNWTNAALTFDQSLPAGRYQVVGARFNSAGLLAYRCVFVGFTWRPGGIGLLTDAQAERDDFRIGRLGVWGEFNHNTPPTMDFCSVTADTAETGELDLIKIA